MLAPACGDMSCNKCNPEKCHGNWEQVTECEFHGTQKGILCPLCQHAYVPPIGSKTKVTYTRQCYLCQVNSVFILRDTNANPDITDEQIPRIINAKSESEFMFCETCKQITKQILVSYKY